MVGPRFALRRSSVRRIVTDAVAGAQADDSTTPDGRRLVTFTHLIAATEAELLRLGYGIVTLNLEPEPRAWSDHDIVVMLN